MDQRSFTKFRDACQQRAVVAGSPILDATIRQIIIRSEIADEENRLLREILATLSIPKNRMNILKGECGQRLLDIADGWLKRFDDLQPNGERDANPANP